MHTIIDRRELTKGDMISITIEAPAIARDSEAFAQLLQRYPELHTLTLQPDAVVFAVLVHAHNPGLLPVFLV